MPEYEYHERIMPEYDCPYIACSYQTSDVTDALAATRHQPGPAAKIERVRRPTVSHAGTSEDWSYFLTRWADYKATKLAGKRPCYSASGVLR